MNRLANGTWRPYFKDSNKKNVIQRKYAVKRQYDLQQGVQCTCYRIASRLLLHDLGLPKTSG